MKIQIVMEMEVDETNFKSEKAQNLFFENLEKKLWDVKVSTNTFNNVTCVSCRETGK